MTEAIEYWNLVTGDRAKESPTIRAYFELAITKMEDEFSSGTSEGEFLCGFSWHPTFKEAWFEALTHTMVGGEAYQAWESRPLPADPGTQPDSPVYQGEGFDPYAGNLDTLLGY